jgi:hypothetical protein
MKKAARPRAGAVAPVVLRLIFLFVFGLVAPSMAILTPVLHSRASASHAEAIDTQPRSG